MYFVARVTLAAALMMLVGVPTSGAAGMPCEGLAQLEPMLGMPGSIFAENNATGNFAEPPPPLPLPPPNPPIVHKELPAHCRVVLKLQPTSDSIIGVEIWLPAEGVWNRKYLGRGNGGYAGAIVYAALADGVRRGYAVANTDMGAAPFSLDGVAMAGHPERWKDWGYRATHEMTVAAKKIINAYYGSETKRSYFEGCSTGGQQGLMEAQRFHEDYDGVIAGAPGNNRTHLATAFVWSFRTITENGTAAERVLSEDALRLLNRSVLYACGTRAGGLAIDPFLSDPRECDFDPATLLCQGSSTYNCLTQKQVTAARALYGGPRNPQNGHLIYPGWPRGSEIRENDLIYRGLFWVFPIQQPPFEGLFRWIFPTEAYWKTFNFDSHMALVDRRLAPILNAMDPNLQPFAKHGGKLILYHGWADAIVAAQDTIDYYNSVVQVQGGLTSSALVKTQAFARLFLAPGMAHCGIGPGPNTIFESKGPWNDPEKDALVALDRWVTTGTAPKRIIAVNGPVSRPLCPYPQRAYYIGNGETNKANNFVCTDVGFGKNQVPAPEYRK